MPFASHTKPVVTDLTIRFSSPTSLPPTYGIHPWCRIDKDLYLHQGKQKAWLYLALVDEEAATADDLVVTDIRIGRPPTEPSPSHPWESRPGGIWILRRMFGNQVDCAVTEIDVLFGTHAVEPRPQWKLMSSALQLDGDKDPRPRWKLTHWVSQLEGHEEAPVARLSILYGRPTPTSDTRAALRVKKDGTIKFVQISDTHMTIGPGDCKDAIDADGKKLPPCEANPLTVKLIEEILDVEEPDLVILTGDQVHHDVPDSQTALFMVVDPIIKRSIPWVAVFGNHDSEGAYALSRKAQMSILEGLPFSLCESGPEQVDGVGNICLDILAPAPSLVSLSTLYLLDSHGEIPSKTRKPDYEPITQSQIDWLTESCQARRSARSEAAYINPVHLSLVFQHIPLPEFGHSDLIIQSGRQREPPEGPTVNTHLYDTMCDEGIVVFGCGHDHVNDHCAQLPPRVRPGSGSPTRPGPWLCYAGAAGYGGYASYGRTRTHRQARVWEIDTKVNSVVTWKRVEYAVDRVDEQVLVKDGSVIEPKEHYVSRTCAAM